MIMLCASVNAIYASIYGLLYIILGTVALSWCISSSAIFIAPHVVAASHKKIGIAMATGLHLENAKTSQHR